MQSCQRRIGRRSAGRGGDGEELAGPSRRQLDSREEFVSPDAPGTEPSSESTPNAEAT